MGDWLKRMSAVAAGRILAWLIISILTTTSLGISFFSTWDYLRTAPWPILFLSLFGLLVAFSIVILFGLIFVSSPIQDGTFGSKYLLWYKLPIRKVSWKFDQFLGGGSGQGQPVLIYSFQPQFKVNWGKGISPKATYIECETTGARQDVLLSPIDQYVKADAVEYIPRGGWFNCQVYFGGITKEAFLQTWDGFKFVFEYNNKSFSREFSRRELEEWIERFWLYSNRRAQPKGRIKSS